MNTLRKSFRKRCYKEPNLNVTDDFQDGVHTFQFNNKTRESLRTRKKKLKLEEDIQAAIQREVSVISASTKLLEVCNNQIQRLEVAKTIVLSKTRLNNLKLTKRDDNSHCENLGNVYLSSIRVPLAWNLDDLINPKKDAKQYAMFVLLACGGVVYDTELIQNIRSESAEIGFTNSFVFSNVPSSFNIDIDIYACEISVSQDRKSLPLHKFLSLLAPKFKKDDIPVEFTCVARAKLTLKDVHKHSSSQVWCMQGDNLSPPLYDYFSFKLTAKPSYKNAAPSSGHVSVSWSDSEIMISNCHAVLMDMTVKLWMSESMHLKGCQPWKVINLNERTLVTSDTEEKEVSWNETDDCLITLTFKTAGESEQWSSTMISQIQCLTAWDVYGCFESKDLDVLSPSTQPTVKYRRRLENKTQSKLILMYNQISSADIFVRNHD